MHGALSFLSIILSLSLVVGVHEAGHALAAVLFKIKIKRISIGFGRPLLRWRSRGGCEWVWAMWPFGGYVQLLDSRIEQVPHDDMIHCFDLSARWKRFIILLAGAIANILMAGLSLVLMLMIGREQIAPVVASISKPSIAATASLVPGDRIIQVASRQTASWQDVGMQLIMNAEQQHVLVVVRHGADQIRHAQLDLSHLHLKRHDRSLLAILGIHPDLSTQRIYRVNGLAFPQALHQACLEMVYLVAYYLMTLKLVISGLIPLSLLLGPLGLFMVMIHSFFQGVAVFLYFIANLSLAVAWINLLPLPGLDGASIAYDLLEKIRGKPLSIALQALLYRLAFIALCVFMVQLLMNDLQRYLVSF